MKFKFDLRSCQTPALLQLGFFPSRVSPLSEAAPSFTATVDASNLQPGRHYTFPECINEMSNIFSIDLRASETFLCLGCRRNMKHHSCHQHQRSPHTLPSRSAQNLRLCTDLDGNTGTMPMGANDFLWYVTGDVFPLFHAATLDNV